jgi:hypothetical protein
MTRYLISDSNNYLHVVHAKSVLIMPLKMAATYVCTCTPARDVVMSHAERLYIYTNVLEQLQ